MSVNENIKCPQCGEKKTYKVFGKLTIFDLILSIITFGIWPIIRAYIENKSNVAKIKPGDKARCGNCGYTWVYE